MKPLVIYHANCNDGLAAAWCFKAAYGDTVEFYPGIYQAGKLPDVVDRDVYLVDFSYPAYQMVQICEHARSVTLLDHHQTAIDACAGMELDYPNFDMSHCDLTCSGGYIAWRYITQHCGVDLGDVPPFLLHIQDRDLWQFKLPGTKAILKGAGTRPFTLDTIGLFMCMSSAELEHIRTLGEILIENEKVIMEGILNQNMRTVDLYTFDTPLRKAMTLVNCPGHFVSELGEMFYKQHKATILMYHDTAAHRVFSLRSHADGGEDVSLIAKEFGGGGHKHAAGFKVDRGHYLAQI